MERIHSGDPSALDAVLRRYRARLVTYASAVPGDAIGAGVLLR